MMFVSPIRPTLLSFFLFNDPPPTEIYTLSLHDALPISAQRDRADDRQHDLRADADGERVGELLLLRLSPRDRKSTRLNSSHVEISYAVFCLKKKKTTTTRNESGTAQYFNILI